MVNRFIVSGSESYKTQNFLLFILFLNRTGTFLGVSISLILINLAAIMERADENLLPSVYKEVLSVGLYQLLQLEPAATSFR